MGVFLYLCTFNYVLYNVCVGWHFPPLRGTPLITVSERERTHALHGDILYPTTSFKAPDASARASVGAPQVVPRLILYMCIRVIL